jgi:hypothetical protein
VDGESHGERVGSAKGAVDVKDDAGGGVDGAYAVDALVALEGCECRGRLSHVPAETKAGAYRAWGERLC